MQDGAETGFENGKGTEGVGEKTRNPQATPQKEGIRNAEVQERAGALPQLQSCFYSLWFCSISIDLLSVDDSIAQ